MAQYIPLQGGYEDTPHGKSHAVRMAEGGVPACKHGAPPPNPPAAVPAPWGQPGRMHTYTSRCACTHTHTPLPVRCAVRPLCASHRDVCD